MLPLIDPIFVPGDRPERVQKAVDLGVDAVIIDFEDAVAPAQKETARQLTADLLQKLRPGCSIGVRVNGLENADLLAADLDALRGCWAMVDAVMLPKAASPDQILQLEELLVAAGSQASILPLVETAQGVENAVRIAAATHRVGTLVLGPADLSSELGVVPTPQGLELLMARSRLVLACAAAGRARPIDGPWLVLNDDAGLAESARQARLLGFGGKASIHPQQLAAIREAFSPSADEVAWARQVLETFEESLEAGVGAVKLADGTFIDAPVADRARSILRSAKQV
ncbi:MAG TPA: CoA ester lyase [Acidimicrobiia bacterium]|nr:CoA ester lyase [Acidimicrobiia bacterium]